MPAEMGTIRHGRYILADIPSSLYYLNLFHLWQWSFHVPYILLFLILMSLRRDFKRRPTRFQRVIFHGTLILTQSFLHVLWFS